MCDYDYLFNSISGSDAVDSLLELVTPLLTLISSSLVKLLGKSFLTNNEMREHAQFLGSKFSRVNKTFTVPPGAKSFSLDIIFTDTNRKASPSGVIKGVSEKKNKYISATKVLYLCSEKPPLRFAQRIQLPLHELNIYLKASIHTWPKIV